MRKEIKLTVNFSVDGILALGLMANVAFFFAAAAGAFGMSRPGWFLGLAVTWLIAAAVGISLIWTHSISIKPSCIHTGVVLAVLALAIWLNLLAISQIMYVA